MLLWLTTKRGRRLNADTPALDVVAEASGRRYDDLRLFPKAFELFSDRRAAVQAHAPRTRTADRQRLQLPLNL